MSTFTVLLFCLQACLVQNVFGVCREGLATIAAPSCGCGGRGYGALGYDGLGFGAGWSGPACGSYGGSGIGNVAVAGELPVAGTTAVAGQVPIIGAVEFGGRATAAGVVSIAGRCGCDCGCGGACGY